MTADEAPVDQTAETEESADLEKAEDVDADTYDGDATPGRFRGFIAAVRKLLSGKVLAAVLAVLVVASLGLFGGVFYFMYLPDRDTDAAAAKTAISAASDGAVAVLSYSPDTLEHDFENAKSRLTGDFLKYYNQFTTQIVGPAAKQKSVKTTAVVLRAALSEFRADSATVLLFVNQSTQSKDRPEPTFSSSSVVVVMNKADGKWLISSFNPV